MNFWDILLVAALAAAVFFALRRILLDRRAGKTCSGNCAGCRLDCKETRNNKHPDKEESP